MVVECYGRFMVGFDGPFAVAAGTDFRRDLKIAAELLVSRLFPGSPGHLSDKGGKSRTRATFREIAHKKPGHLYHPPGTVSPARHPRVGLGG